MKILEQKLDAGFPEGFHEGDALLDIETTGLSRRRSHLYLIGVLFQPPSARTLTLRQWFLESPLEEETLLRDAAGFLSGFRRAVHYNGDSFDLPYLREKWREYRIEPPLEHIRSLDLYRSLRPCAAFLGLSSMRQRDLEEWMGIAREDRASGKELIGVYQRYLLNREEEDLAELLLHNREDLLGLLKLLPLLPVSEVFEGAFSVREACAGEQELRIVLQPRCRLPEVPGLSRECSFPLGSARFDTTEVTLCVPARIGELKYFFSDYRSYYYLPGEDEAIHKSVGVFVDPAHRQQATKKTCYQRRRGCFFPEPEAVFSPCFQESCGSAPLYFEWDSAKAADPERLREYALGLLRELLKTCAREDSPH